MNWKRLLAYITGSVDQELLLRNEYLATENRILRSQIEGRLRLTDPDRINLAKIGKRLGRRALEEVAHPEKGCAEFGARTLQRRSLLEPENRLERGRLARRGHPSLFFSSLLRFTASGRLATHGPFVAEWISGPLLHHLPNGNHEHKAQDRHPKP